MTIKELSHEEQIALVALLEAVAITDRDLSEVKEQELGKVAQTLGDEKYRELIAETESRFGDLEDLKPFLKRISNQETRELIYGEVLEEIGPEAAFDRSESDLLEWLAQTWNIQTEITPEPDAEQV
jgi:hypothetical protein